MSGIEIDETEVSEEMAELMETVIRHSNDKRVAELDVLGIETKYHDDIEKAEAALKAVKDKMADEVAEAGLLIDIERAEASLVESKDALLKGWDLDKKVAMRRGVKFQIQTRSKPNVLDPKAAVTVALGMAEPPLKLDRLPWDNKSLLKAVEAGVFDAAVVTKAETSTLAVTLPKPEE
jgi:hypothetical protein